MAGRKKNVSMLFIVEAPRGADADETLFIGHADVNITVCRKNPEDVPPKTKRAKKAYVPCKECGSPLLSDEKALKNGKNRLCGECRTKRRAAKGGAL